MASSMRIYDIVDQFLREFFKGHHFPDIDPSKIGISIAAIRCLRNGIEENKQKISHLEEETRRCEEELKNLAKFLKYFTEDQHKYDQLSSLVFQYYHLCHNRKNKLQKELEIIIELESTTSILKEFHDEMKYSVKWVPAPTNEKCGLCWNRGGKDYVYTEMRNRMLRKLDDLMELNESLNNRVQRNLDIVHDYQKMKSDLEEEVEALEKQVNSLEFENRLPRDFANEHPTTLFPYLSPWRRGIMCDGENKTDSESDTEDDDDSDEGEPIEGYGNRCEGEERNWEKEEESELGKGDDDDDDDDYDGDVEEEEEEEEEKDDDDDVKEKKIEKDADYCWSEIDDIDDDDWEYDLCSDYTDEFEDDVDSLISIGINEAAAGDIVAGERIAARSVAAGGVPAGDVAGGGVAAGGVAAGGVAAGGVAAGGVAAGGAAPSGIDLKARVRIAVDEFAPFMSKEERGAYHYWFHDLFRYEYPSDDDETSDSLNNHRPTVVKKTHLKY